MIEAHRRERFDQTEGMARDHLWHHINSLPVLCSVLYVLILLSFFRFILFKLLYILITI
jgi:hypothetical protein